MLLRRAGLTASAGLSCLFLQGIVVQLFLTRIKNFIFPSFSSLYALLVVLLSTALQRNTIRGT